MTLAIIQARIGSHRFKNKVLADLNGKPVLAHVVERVRQIKGVDDVVLAVPRGEVAALAYCGNVVGPDVAEDDVLGRFVEVAERFSAADTCVRLTADCPLLDPEVCERLLNVYHASPWCEYAWIDTRPGTGWPDGLDAECFSRDLLMRAHAEATDPADREHVTSWMRRNAAVLSLPSELKYQDWPKVSIDTPDDLERVRVWMQRS